MPFPPCQPQPPSGGNQAPVADPQTLATAESTPLTVTLTGSDADGDTLTYTIVAQPAHGTLTRTDAEEGGGEGDLDPAAFTYTPSPGYAGADSFTFKVNDGQADSNVATVTITITALPATIDAFAAAAIPAPAASITATPSTGTAPLTSTVTWSTENASAVTVTGPGLTATDASGSATVTNAPGTHTCTVTAQPRQHTTLTWTASHAATSILETPSGDLDVTGQTSAGITEPGEYRLRVTNSAGVATTSAPLAIAWPAAATASATITVSAPPPPVISTFVATAVSSPAASINATPSEGTAPLTSTITWSTANASSTVTVAGPGLTSAEPTGSASVTNTAGPHTYTITAQPVQHTTLTWTVAGAISVRLTGPGGVDMDVTGQNSSEITTAGEWTLVAHNAINVTTTQTVTIAWPAAATASTTITVTDPPPANIDAFGSVLSHAPTASISAAPSEGEAPLISTVTWGSSNAASVTVSGPGLASSEASGSQTVANEAGTHTYTITAQPERKAMLTWTVNGAASVVLVTPSGEQNVTGQNSIEVTEPGEYRLQASNSIGTVTTSDAVTVAWPAAATVSATITIAEIPVGPLTVDAGPDRLISLPSTVTITPVVLDEGQSLASPLTYSWVASTVKGSGSASFDNNAGETTVISFTAPGVYKITVTARASGKLGSDSLIVTVQPVPVSPDITAVTTAGCDYWMSFLPNFDPYLSANLCEITISSRETVHGVITEYIPEYNTYNERIDSHIVRTHFWLKPEETYKFHPTAYNAAREANPDHRFIDNLYATGLPLHSAIRIQTDAPVTVHGMSIAEYTTEGYLCLPVHLLGKDYMALSYPQPVEYPNGSLFAIIATEDNTICRIEPKGMLRGRSGENHIQPFTVTLHAGEVIRYESAIRDVTGSKISADKSIAVLSGSIATFIPDEKFASDTLVEQMLPIEYWGRNHVVLPMKEAGRLDEDFTGDIVRVLANQDDTEVSINGIVVANLRAREHYETTIAISSSIVSSKPVQVAQFMPGCAYRNTASGDPLMMLLPAVEQFGRFLQFSTLDRAPNGDKIFEHYAGIITDRDFVDDLRLNGAPLPPDVNFEPIADTRYVGANILIEEGFNVIESDKPFFGVGWGIYPAESYGFTGAIAVNRPASDLTLVAGELPPVALVGFSQEISARIVNAWGIPVSGVTIEFTITGSHIATIQGTSDASGWVRINYTGTVSGLDAIQACIAEQQVHWTLAWRKANPESNQAPVIDIGGDRTFFFSEVNPFMATVTDDGQPLVVPAIRWQVIAGIAGSVIAAPASTTTCIAFPTPGRYLVRATAFDGELESSAEAWITLLSDASIRLINPRPGLSTWNYGEPSEIAFEANAISENRIVSVEFLVNGAPVGTVTSAPWTFNWRIPSAGTYVISARMTDHTGVVMESSSATVQVNDDLRLDWVSPDYRTYFDPEPVLFEVDVRGGTAPYYVEFVEGDPNRADSPVLAVFFDAPFVFGWEDIYEVIRHDGHYVGVRVTDATGKTITGDRWFNIWTEPYIEVLAPVGGSRFATGEKIDLSAYLKSSGFYYYYDNVRFLIDGKQLYEVIPDFWDYYPYYMGDGIYEIPEVPVPAGIHTLVARFDDSENSRWVESEPVTFEVLDATHQPPVVHLGPDIVVPAGGTLDFPAIAINPVAPGEEEAYIRTTVAEELLSYTWTRVSGPSVTIEEPSRLGTGMTFHGFGAYVLRLMVNDGVSLGYDDLSIILQPGANQPPVVSLGGEPVELPLSDVLRLAAAATDDGLPQGSTLAYAWSQDSGPGAVTFRPAPSDPDNDRKREIRFSAEGVYVIRLTVSDGELQGAATLTVTVGPARNAAPYVDAGADATVSFGAQLGILPYVADDGLPAGGQLTGLWTQASGPAGQTATFTSPPPGDDPDGQDGQENPFRTQVSFPATGVYKLRLTVSDGELTTTDEVTVVVEARANTAPVVNLGEDIELPRGTPLILNPGISDDGLPTGSKLIYQWSQVSGPYTVGISDARAVSATFTFPYAGDYTLRLSVSDGALSTVASIVVHVIESYDAKVNKAPVVDAGEDLTINLGDTIFLQGTASDDGLPYGSFYCYWNVQSQPQGASVYAQYNGAWRSLGYYGDNNPTPRVRFTQPGEYVLRLYASDNYKSAEDFVKITVVDDGTGSETSFAPQVKLPVQVSVSAGSMFRIAPQVTYAGNSWGEVLWTQELPAAPRIGIDYDYYESPTFTAPDEVGDYILRLTATDYYTKISGYAEVRVVVTAPANQPPVVRAGLDCEIAYGVTLSVQGYATDDGQPIDRLTTRWEQVSGPGAVTFSQPQYTNTNVTFPVAGDYVIALTATDQELTVSDEMRIRVLPPPPLPLQVFLPEDFEAAALSVSTLNAAVRGGNADTLAYQWSRVSGAASGLEITTPAQQNAQVRWKQPGVYTLRLTVSDGSETAFGEVAVTVTESSNRPPNVIATYPASTIYAGLDGYATDYVEAAATDPDGDAITIEFYRSGSSTPLYTTPAPDGVTVRWAFSDLAPGTYQFYVVARDTRGGSQQTPPATVTVLPPETGGSGEGGGTTLLGIETPEEEALVITRTQVKGWAKVPGMSGYRLETRPVAGPGEAAQEWAVFASGVQSVGSDDASGELGWFEPGMLRNGQHQLRVVATFTGGLPERASDPVTVLVDGKRKIGAFSLAFKDLALPLAGLPIEIMRSYDSRDR
ncbi:MAG: cadherin-like domain-containing protein, partial [Opitutaceae bacterium]|nr:cadherin-like domain-containing protein [Opitutaceae bacterium]